MNISNTLIFMGFIFLISGLIFKFRNNFKLPGDILFQKKNFTFYFPITTCILISIILSLLFFIFKFILKK